MILGGKGVDDTDVPGFGGQSTHIILGISPPGLTKVIGPVRARKRRWDMQKSSLGGVVLEAAC